MPLCAHYGRSSNSKTKSETVIFRFDITISEFNQMRAMLAVRIYEMTRLGLCEDTVTKWYGILDKLDEARLVALDEAGLRLPDEVIAVKPPPQRKKPEPEKLEPVMAERHVWESFLLGPPPKRKKKRF